MASRSIEDTARPRPSGGEGLRGWGRLVLWLSLWQERRALRILDARMLADVGLDPADARREGGRPPWDVPQRRI